MAKNRKTGGRDFKKGDNGGVHRGPNLIPSTYKLFARAYLFDEVERAAIWQALRVTVRKYPQRAIEVFDKLADRAEGKPKQAMEVSEKRTTIFRERSVVEADKSMERVSE